jgi:hypothetical protein
MTQTGTGNEKPREGHVDTYAHKGKGSKARHRL